MKNLVAAISLLLLVISTPLYAQDLDSLLDELIFEDEEFLSLIERSRSYHYLYFSSNFRSNTYFAGRDFGTDQFNLSNQISYFHSNGLSVAVAGILYQEFEPRYNTTILSVGYSKELNFLEGLRVRASYDRYFFAEVDSLESSSFNSSLNFGTSYRFKNFRTSANVSVLLGEDPSTQFNWDLQGGFTLWKETSLKRLRFQPGISFFFASESVLSTTTIETPGRPLRTNFVETTIEEDKYGLLNTQIRLPFTLTYNNFDFEVGYSYNLPRSLGDETFDNTSFFNVRVGYLINLKKKK